MAILLRECGLLWNDDLLPGAQTERRGGTGPVRGLLGGKASPSALSFQQSGSVVRSKEMLAVHLLAKDC
jgi:hypothetical protein